MIEIHQLYKSFGTNHVIKGLDLDFSDEGITAVLGPNGSGKTTLIKCILGLVIPDKGEILFNGKPTKNQFIHRKEIAYLSQIANFPDNLTIQELIDLLKDLRPEKTRESYLISLFGLEPEMGKKMRNLSGGTKQKVNLVLTFLYDSPLIILDEPSTGLDPLALIHLKEFLQEERKNGKKILVTTHIMSLVEDLAENIVFLLEGKVYYQGNLKALIEKEKEQKLENAIAHILEVHGQNI